MTAYGSCSEFEKQSFLACSTCPHYKKTSCTGGEALHKALRTNYLARPADTTKAVVCEALRNGPTVLWLRRYGQFEKYKALVKSAVHKKDLERSLNKYAGALELDEMERLKSYVGTSVGILGHQSNMFAGVVVKREQQKVGPYGILTGNTRTFRTNGNPWITWVEPKILRAALHGLEDEHFNIRFNRGRHTTANIDRMRRWAHDHYTVII